MDSQQNAAIGMTGIVMFFAFLLKNWKYVAIGVGVVFLLITFKLWLNGHDDRVYKDGQVASANTYKDAAEKDLAVARKKIETDQAKVAADTASLEAVKSQIKKDGDALVVLQRQALSNIQKSKEAAHDQVVATPPSELDALLRRLSNDLAAVGPAH